MPKYNVTIEKHYDLDDPDCIGDYREIHIFINDLKVIEYGDHYHDKGYDKAQGYVDALKSFYGDDSVVVENTNVVDYE